MVKHGRLLNEMKRSDDRRRLDSSPRWLSSPYKLEMVFTWE